jgi:hemoglobin
MKIELRKSVARFCPILLLLLGAVILINTGCGSSKTKRQNQTFFTSGSKEADQRASQRMAKEEQLGGSGEGAGEKRVNQAKPQGGGTNGTGGVQAEAKRSLYDRLGGEQGLTKIIDDFMPRALQDPRVNWSRQGQGSGGFLHHRSHTWTNSPANVAALKKHMIQFLALATGGPAHYEGKEMRNVHSGMAISNPEFDATIGDLKATLDKLQIPNQEQKELLAIVESTRPEIVTER